MRDGPSKAEAIVESPGRPVVRRDVEHDQIHLFKKPAAQLGGQRRPHAPPAVRRGGDQIADGRNSLRRR